MLLHIVRYEREEVGFFMILSVGRGPEILAASTPFLRGADRVLFDLSVLATFPMTSMSMALSILHVGLVLGVELQLRRDVLHDLVQAPAGEDDLHPQRLSAPPLRVVEAHQPLPHGVAEYLRKVISATDDQKMVSRDKQGGTKNQQRREERAKEATRHRGEAQQKKKQKKRKKKHTNKN